MECTNCGYEIINVYSARSVELTQPAGNTWVEKKVFSSGCSCPNCNEELSDNQMDELGIPEGYR